MSMRGAIFEALFGPQFNYIDTDPTSISFDALYAYIKCRPCCDCRGH